MKFDLSEIQDVIKSRRSIKPENFSTRQVHKEIVTDILDAARWAPTHGMTQPWRFKVFMENGLDKIAEFQSELYRDTCQEGEFVQAKFDKLRNRPKLSSVLIAICMDRQESEKIPEIEEIASVACSVQNMSLICTAYGLGAYWSTGGMTYKEEMKSYLGLEKSDKVLGFLYVGYPEGDWPTGQRRPIEYYTEWISQ